MSDPIAPATHGAPAPIDLSAEATRHRLGPAALKAFSAIVARWRLDDRQARALLGWPPQGRAWREEPDRALAADTLTRLSCLVGIFEALGALYGESLVDDWVNLPNDNPVFGGRTPLAFIIAGGIPALLAVRRLLDARRTGT